MDRDGSRAALFDQLAVVGKAFGSARRLELVDLLAQSERSVESLAQAAGLSVSATSAHLQVLKLANLVRTRRDGQKIYYRLAGDDVAGLYDGMRTVASNRSADVQQALHAYMELPGADEIGLVGRDELVSLLQAGEVVLLDVRPPEEYRAGHIPGARNVPLQDVAAIAPQLRDREDVVAYCRGRFCVLAHDAVRLLDSQGVPARRLEDGMLEWRTNGHPVEVGTPA